MSYGGVESEYEYAERILRDRDHARWRQSPEGRRAEKERELERLVRTRATNRGSIKTYEKQIRAARERVKDYDRAIRKLRRELRV